MATKPWSFQIVIFEVKRTSNRVLLDVEKIASVMAVSRNKMYVQLRTFTEIEYIFLKPWLFLSSYSLKP